MENSVFGAIANKRRFVARFAVLGLVIAFVFWAYNASNDHTKPMNYFHAAVTVGFVVLCPPSILSIPFWEPDPDSLPGIVIRSVIGLLNSALYAAIALAIRWRADRTMAGGT